MKYCWLVVALALSGCEIIQDQLLDCLDDDGPEFDLAVLPHAVLNQVYSITITARIRHEPNDKRWDYKIAFGGALPQGLNYRDDGNERTFVIEGTPTEHGTFNFTLSVDVDNPYVYEYSTNDFYDDGDNLCFTHHEQGYVLSVDMM